MYDKRRKNLNKLIEHQSIVILFSGTAPNKTNDQLYPFVVNRNFYYLTGLEEPKMALVVIKSDEGISEYLFKEYRSKKQALWIGDVMSEEEVTEISKIENIRNIEHLHQFLIQITSSGRGATYGVLNNIYLDIEVDHPHSKAYKLSKVIKKDFPFLNIIQLNDKLAYLRMFKDLVEIENIEKAIEITDLGLKNILKSLKPGLMEYEVEAEFNYVLNKHNVVPSFNTIAAAGKNATILHYEANNQKLEDNSLMLFDLGVEYNNYASDISRTYPVNGKFTKCQKEIYEIVLKANKETIKMLKPGVTWKEFNDFAKDILADGLIKLGKISKKEELSKYYYHSIGHFLGLDVHDVGIYSEPLKEGMVVTVEPGLYLEDEGIGIRIEDDILITRNGSRNLSKNLIKEIDDIENFMK